MADWPLLADGQRLVTVGLSGMDGTSVPGAAANTKGAWTALSASTPIDAAGLLVNLQKSGEPVQFLVDLAVGPAGSEVVVLADLWHGSQSNLNMHLSYVVPIAVPGGSRLSARCQGNAGNPSIRVSAMLVGQGFLPSQPLAVVDTFGVDAAVSAGTELDAGLTANTKGAWVQFSASTPRPISMLLVAGVGYTTLDSIFRFDVGIGAAGSEIVVVPDLGLRMTGATRTPSTPVFGPLPCHIPAGTRVAMRCASDQTGGGDRFMRAILYGVCG